MKKSVLLMFAVFLIMLPSCSDSSSRSAKYDDEYWRSVKREETMEKAGLKDAAKRERTERRDKLKGRR